jgi:hypothetical protein
MPSVIQLPNNPPQRLWFGDSFRLCTNWGAQVPFQVIGLTGVYPNTFDCRPSLCECIDVYAEQGNPTDDLNNDASSFLFDFPSTTGDTYYLDKFVSGSWVNVDELDATTGIKYPIGYWAEYPKRGGVFISWNKVLNLHGLGTYRLRLGNILPPPAPDVIMTSACFNLKLWSCQAVDNTVIVEVYFRKVVTNKLFNENAPTPLNFDCTQMTSQQGAGWYDRNRYKGRIGKGQVKQKKEVKISYFSGFVNNTNSIDVLVYPMQLALLSEDLKERLIFYCLKADKVQVTDSAYTNNTVPKTRAEKQYYKRLEVTQESNTDVNYAHEGNIPLSIFSIQKRTNIIHGTS